MHNKNRVQLPPSQSYPTLWAIPWLSHILKPQYTTIEHIAKDRQIDQVDQTPFWTSRDAQQKQGKS